MTTFGSGAERLGDPVTDAVDELGEGDDVPGDALEELP